MEDKLDKILLKFDQLIIDNKNVTNRISVLENMFQEMQISKNIPKKIEYKQQQQYQQHQYQQPKPVYITSQGNSYDELLVCKCENNTNRIIDCSSDTIYKIQTVLSNNLLASQYTNCFWCTYIFLINNENLLNNLVANK